MLHLRIRSQQARLSLEVRSPEIRLDIPRPWADISVKQPSLSVEIDQPRVEIDSRSAHAEVGLRGIGELAAEGARLGREKALDGITRRSQDGDALAAIEKGVRVAEITARNAWPEETRDLNVDVVPKSRVTVRASGGVSVSTSPGDVVVEMQAKWAGVSLQRGEVKTYLTQKASIDIETVGNRYSVLV